MNTADKLFHMTRENLVHARLPHFHIPAAVETLTTGTDHYFVFQKYITCIGN